MLMFFNECTANIWVWVLVYITKPVCISLNHFSTHTSLSEYSDMHVFIICCLFARDSLVAILLINYRCFQGFQLSLLSRFSVIAAFKVFNYRCFQGFQLSLLSRFSIIAAFKVFNYRCFQGLRKQELADGRVTVLQKMRISHFQWNSKSSSCYISYIILDSVL